MNLLNIFKVKNKDELTLVFKNGILQRTIPKIKTGENYYGAKYIISDGIKYDIENQNDIVKIHVPEFKDVDLMKDLGVTGALDYILRMKAGYLRAKGMNELSIICLRKATELMIASPIAWRGKDYLRLARWLIEDGRFDEAEREEQLLREKLPLVFNQNKRQQHLNNKVFEFCKDFNTDLVEASHHFSCSSEEAKYRGRIFSINGKDGRFPQLTEEILNCGLNFYPFIYGTSTPNFCSRGDEIKYSNRPFLDDRTQEEIDNYTDYLKGLENEKQKELDRIEYYKILQQLPDIAPKSFGAYRRIKI